MCAISKDVTNKKDNCASKNEHFKLGLPKDKGNMFEKYKDVWVNEKFNEGKSSFQISFEKIFAPYNDHYFLTFLCEMNQEDCEGDECFAGWTKCTTKEKEENYPFGSCTI